MLGEKGLKRQAVDGDAGADYTTVGGVRSRELNSKVSPTVPSTSTAEASRSTSTD